MRTNGVLIPIIQLGVYGSAFAEASELPGVSAFAALASEPQPEVRFQKASINLNDCFPERTEIAVIVGRNLGRSINAASQDIASALAEARQAQLLGVTEDNFDSGEVLDAACRLMQTRIQPYFADAASNCELMKVLLIKTVGIERQRQLLGADPNAACSSALSDLPLCAGLQNCLKEIEICCLGGRKGPGKVAAILALSRQDGLLGTHCLSSTAIEQAIDACTSNTWTGTLSFNASSERVTDTSDRFVTQITTERYKAQFYGEVWEAQELIFPGFGGSVTMRLRGRVTYEDYYNQTTETSGECGGNKSIDQSQTVAATETWFRVDLNINANGTYSLLVANIDNNTGISGAEATDTNFSYSRRGQKVFTDQGSECVSKVETRTTTRRDIALLPPAMFLNGTMSDTNGVTGQIDLPKFTDYPPTDGHYEWSFQRHRAE